MSSGVCDKESEYSKLLNLQQGKYEHSNKVEKTLPTTVDTTSFYQAIFQASLLNEAIPKKGDGGVVQGFWHSPFSGIEDEAYQIVFFPLKNAYKWKLTSTFCWDIAPYVKDRSVAELFSEATLAQTTLSITIQTIDNSSSVLTVQLHLHLTQLGYKWLEGCVDIETPAALILEDISGHLVSQES